MKAVVSGSGGEGHRGSSRLVRNERRPPGRLGFVRLQPRRKKIARGLEFFQTGFGDGYLEGKGMSI